MSIKSSHHKLTLKLWHQKRWAVCVAQCWLNICQSSSSSSFKHLNFCLYSNHSRTKQASGMTQEFYFWLLSSQDVTFRQRQTENWSSTSCFNQRQNSLWTWFELGPWRYNTHVLTASSGTSWAKSFPWNLRTSTPASVVSSPLKINTYNTLLWKIKNVWCLQCVVCKIKM